MHLHFRGVNDAFIGILERFTKKKLPVTMAPRHAQVPLTTTQSRNGPVLQMTEPLTITYYNPWKRCLFNPIRNCNPFFHFAESLWMLAGMQDTGTICHYNQRMMEYSDDSETFWGAYGYRWRHWFKNDQIENALALLRADPTTRRVVISMWDPSTDLPVQYKRGGKDIPCNTHLYLQVVEGKLTMTVCNRSNDIIWGMLGANAFHFSFLQEYLATLLHLPMGALHQFSTNPHLYTDIFPQDKLDQMLEWDDNNVEPRPYSRNIDTPNYDGPWYPDPMLDTKNSGSCSRFIPDIKLILDNPLAPAHKLTNSHTTQESSSSQMCCGYLLEVATPILRAWEYHKLRNYGQALTSIANCTRWDYELACTQWLKRTRDRYIHQNPHTQEN